MRLKRFILWLLVLASPAMAQQPSGTYSNQTAVTPSTSTAPTNGGYRVPAYAIFCADGVGNAKVCTFSGGAGAASGTGTDASASTANSVSGLVVLTSFTVANPGAYRCWNNSASEIYIAFGAAGSQTTQALDPAASSGQQGGDTSPEMAWFTGLITVYGTAGSIVPCRHY